MRTAAHGPRGHHSSKGALDWVDPCCFFLIAVGYKVPWTAISSLLHQFNQQFQQPKVLLWLNLAYFLPSIPALLLHSSLQDVLEQRLGVPKAAVARFIFGLGSLACLCLAFPACSSSLSALLTVTAAVGVAYSIAFGTSHQLVPRFTQRSTVALNTGFVSCGVVVLLSDLLLKPHSANYTPAALKRLFQVAALQTMVGLLSAVLLLRRSWRRLHAAGKQQQHQVIGVLPPTGGGLFGRVGSGSSGSSGRQLLLPPRGSVLGATGNAAAAGGGAIGFRHVSHNSSGSMTGGYQGCGSGHSSFSSQQQPGPYQQQQQWDTLKMNSDNQCVNEGCSASGISVHVTVSSDDGSNNSSSSLAHGQSGPAVGQVTSGTSSHWDLSHQKKPRISSSSGSKGGGLMQRLQPLLLLLQLAWRIWPAWLALLMSVGSSMLLFPLFTCVDTSGRLGDRLPQILFYARLLGDILGRMVPPAWQLSSSRAVLSAAFLKTKLLVVLVPAILQPSLVGGDIPLAALVAVNWWLSGYINTGAYLLAPRLATFEAAGITGGLRGLRAGGKGSTGFSGVGSGRSRGWALLGMFGFRRRARLAATGKDHGSNGSSSTRSRAGNDGVLGALGSAALRSKAGAVMSFCFQASCLLGLLAAWLVQELLHEAGHPAFAGSGKAAGVAAAATAALKAAGLHSRGFLTAGAVGGGDGGVDGVGLSDVAGFGGDASAGGGVGAAAAAFAAAAATVVGGSPAAT